MSDLTKSERNGYRPIGKHRYGIILIVSFAALLLLFTLLEKLLDTFPNRDAVVGRGYVLLAIFGILESVWTILMPQRSRKATESGHSLRTVRVQGAFLLTAWAAILFFAIQKLF